MKKAIEFVKTKPHELMDYLFHIVFFACLFMVIGYYMPQIYYRYFDNTEYYKIYNPITVEKKVNKKCSYIDAYIHRKALVPIKGSSVKQLTLIRVDNGMRERITNYYSDIQAEVGESTIIAHWTLPCDIPSGTYLFEGTVQYMVRDITKYTQFYTEYFEIVASDSANTNGK